MILCSRLNQIKYVLRLLWNVKMLPIPRVICEWNFSLGTSEIFNELSSGLGQDLWCWNLEKLLGTRGWIFSPYEGIIWGEGGRWLCPKNFAEWIKYDFSTSSTFYSQMGSSTVRSNTLWTFAKNFTLVNLKSFSQLRDISSDYVSVGILYVRDSLVWIDEETYNALEIFSSNSHSTVYRMANMNSKDGFSIHALFNRCWSPISSRYMRLVCSNFE